MFSTKCLKTITKSIFICAIIKFFLSNKSFSRTTAKNICYLYNSN